MSSACKFLVACHQLNCMHQKLGGALGKVTRALHKGVQGHSGAEELDGISLCRKRLAPTRRLQDVQYNQALSNIIVPPGCSPAHHAQSTQR